MLTDFIYNNFLSILILCPLHMGFSDYVLASICQHYRQRLRKNNSFNSEIKAFAPF